eukprot:s1952_g2.t1
MMVIVVLYGWQDAERMQRNMEAQMEDDQETIQHTKVHIAFVKASSKGTGSLPWFHGGCCGGCESPYCSPHSGRCYETKNELYYYECDPSSRVPRPPNASRPTCCETCASAFCSPYSGGCYNAKDATCLQPSFRIPVSRFRRVQRPRAVSRFSLAADMEAQCEDQQKELAEVKAAAAKAQTELAERPAAVAEALPIFLYCNFSWTLQYRGYLSRTREHRKGGFATHMRVCHDLFVAAEPFRTCLSVEIFGDSETLRKMERWGLPIHKFCTRTVHR